MVSDADVYLSPNAAVVYGDEVVAVTSSNAISPNITQPATMTKPCSIDADGENIYIAGLNADSEPVLIKFPASLNADGSLVFSPGSGTNIGVQCGRFDNDVVWVAGNFGGTDVVEKSEDGGSTFVVKDDGAINSVNSFIVGPDSDDRVLLVDSDDDILETIDDGETWTNLASGITPVPLALARLDKNIQETVFGNQGDTTDNINYSINSGIDLEDYTSGFDKERDITGLEVG